MIRDPGIAGFWIVNDEGMVIEASNDLEKLLKRAQELAQRAEERMDIVHYLGSFYPEREQLPETL